MYSLVLEGSSWKVNDDAVEILLVEDNQDDAELTLRALRKNNLANRIHIVNDGAEALDFIFGKSSYAGRNTDCSPKVILLDLKLPKISGLEVLGVLKSDERTKTIPVVVMTSSQEERDIVESYKLGVNSYITKPIDFDKFSQTVAQIGMYWLLLNKKI